MSWKQRGLGLLIDLAALAAFGIVIIAAGHGAGPVGILMFIGSASAWGLPMAIGWGAIAALIVASFIPFRWPYLVVTLSGYAALAASLAIFVSRSERPEASAVFATPFAGALVGRAVYLFFQVRRRAGAWNEEGQGSWNDQPYGRPRDSERGF